MKYNLSSREEDMRTKFKTLLEELEDRLKTTHSKYERVCLRRCIKSIKELYPELKGDNGKIESEPLDLKGMRVEVHKSIRKKIKESGNPRWKEEFEEFRNLDLTYDIVKLILDMVKKKVKQACEFYLKFVNRPDRFMREIEISRKKKYEDFLWLWQEENEDFNTTLFKFVFADVLKND